VCRFNSEGMATFVAMPEMACLHPLLQRVRDPLANAFVVNLLVCGASPHDYEGGEAERQDVVGWHLDNTLGQAAWSNLRQVAHSTSVYYTAVPHDIRGGELELRHARIRPDQYFSSEQRKRIIAADPTDRELLHDAVTVAPLENMLTVFRGDAFHRVRPYMTDSNVRRTSVVIEQYRVAREHYWKTTEHWCTMKVGED